MHKHQDLNPSNLQYGALPYRDSKPVGAADFYFAINATFRFVFNRCGEEGLRRYWRDLGEQYMAPVWGRWRELGLPGIASYWREFFQAEPGSNVVVTESAEQVVLDVRTCPAIAHLRGHGREIEPRFCQHCYFMGDAAAQRAGFTVRVEGGDGSCRQTFIPLSSRPQPQRLEAILEAH